MQEGVKEVEGKSRREEEEEEEGLLKREEREEGQSVVQSRLVTFLTRPSQSGAEQPEQNTCNLLLLVAFPHLNTSTPPNFTRNGLRRLDNIKGAWQGSWTRRCTWRTRGSFIDFEGSDREASAFCRLPGRAWVNPGRYVLFF